MSEPLIAELEKCIANMERDINECDKIYIHISNAKALVDQLNRTQPNEPVCHALIGVMHSVDKWLDDDELKQDEVNRAATMREKVLKIIERLQSENATLKKALELACESIAGEMPYGEANGYYEYYIKKAKEESENESSL